MQLQWECSMSAPNDGRPPWVPAHATGWKSVTQNNGMPVPLPVTDMSTITNPLTGVRVPGPSLRTMVNNLAGTALSAMQHVVHTGVVFAPESVVNSRLAICESCEFLDKNIYRCLKCGCMMKFKAKVEIAKCPIAKW